MKKQLFIILIIFFCSFTEDKIIYKDKNQPIINRVDDLLKRMTLEEKIRQMDMYYFPHFQNSKNNLDSLVNSIGKLGVGSVMNVAISPKQTNELQKKIIENSRLGIPALIINEMHHGFTEPGSTVFPSYLSLASTFDRDAVYKVGRGIATEMRAFGSHFGLAPNLDLSLDPRYGRFNESFSEDPFLTAEMGVSIIKGLQGDGLNRNNTIAAEPKHFLGHGSPSGGFHIGPVLIGERELRSKHMYPFARVIKDAGILGIMNSYDEIDGVVSSTSEYYLTDVLRGELGFEGFVLADWGSISIQRMHGVSKDMGEAFTKSFNAGIDMQFNDISNKDFVPLISELVKTGSIDIKVIDKSVSRILKVKFELGLFDNPYIDENLVQQVLHSSKHQDYALNAARKGIVLLKNSHKTLPIDVLKTKKIAVIGPLANKMEYGGYSPKLSDTIVYNGLVDELKKINGIEVNYAKGCDIINLGEIIPKKYLYRPDKKQNGLVGEYFSNANLEGKPKKEDIVDEVKFIWKEQGVAEANISTASFSARWSGYLKIDKDFEGWIGAVADDGFRLFIDDKIFLEKWGSRTPLTKKELILKKDQFYKISVEFYNSNWSGKIELRMGENKVDFSEALLVAQNSDVIIAMLGDSPEIIGENVDMSLPKFPDVQEKLIEALYKTGKPLVVCLQNGRPYILNQINDLCDVLLEAWYSGEKGSQALAEIILGKVNPSGKLPVTYPKTFGQFPYHYNQTPSMKHKYIDVDDSPLYPFGFGLSYTTFDYSNLKIEKKEYDLNRDTEIAISIDVKNTADVEGEEIVQVYINDVVSSVTTPQKKLVNFNRVFLKPGEQKTVALKINIADLSLWNQDMKKVVEEGVFKIMVGPNSMNYIVGLTSLINKK